MSSTYTPDPTATQAPAAAPDPDNFPSEVLPSDGDADNAASVAQAFKVLGDYVSWLKAPRAKVSAFTQAIRRYKNARLQDRFKIGHGGLPEGRYYHFTEMWTPGTSFNIGSLSPTQIGKWFFQGVGSGGSLTTVVPGAATLNPSNLWRCLNLTVDSSGAAKQAEIRIADDSTTTLFTDDAYAYVEFEFSLRTVTSMNWVVGMTSVGEAINGITHGIYIIRPDVGGTNYKCRTVNGGAPTEIDSGIAGTAGVLHKAKVEWWGANISDDSAARAVFIIDDTLVANISTTLPNSAPHQLVPCFGGFSTGSVANATLFLGPVNYGQITKA